VYAGSVPDAGSRSEAGTSSHEGNTGGRKTAMTGAAHQSVKTYGLPRDISPTDHH
jgi:hypothetical protein